MIKSVVLVFLGLFQGIYIAKYDFEHAADKVHDTQQSKEQANILTLKQQIEIESKKCQQLIEKIYSNRKMIDSLKDEKFRLNKHLLRLNEELKQNEKFYLAEKRYYETNEALYLQRLLLTNQMQTINQQILQFSFEIKEKEKRCSYRNKLPKYKDNCKDFDLLVRKNNAMLMEFDRLGVKFDAIMRKLTKQKKKMPLIENN